MSTSDRDVTRVCLETVVRVLVAVALGGIGGAAGFLHTHNWAQAHGQTGWLAWADAVVIEGLAVVAGMEVRRDHATGRTGRAALLPKVVLAVAFGVQMTAQVALAQPTPAGWLLAAMPALGFLCVVKLALRRLPASEPATTPAAPPPPAAAAMDHPAPPVTGPAPATGPPPVAAAPPRPAAATLTRLPAATLQTVLDTAQAARAAGRPVTAADLRKTITLPDAMAAALVAELNA